MYTVGMLTYGCMYNAVKYAHTNLPRIQTQQPQSSGRLSHTTSLTYCALVF